MKVFIVPIIAFICYLFDELWKLIFAKKQDLYAYIPFISALMGGTIGILIFLINPEVISMAENVWIALEIGMISGLSSTGANQFLKQYQKITKRKTY